MTDHLEAKARSSNMARIKGADTKPEILVRSVLFQSGFRFRKNDKRFPGTPDIILPKYKTAVFVNGCFWHGHDCKRATIPKTNTEFWRTKIEKNMLRDAENLRHMERLGWHTYTIWTCSLSEGLKGLLNFLEKQKT